MLESLSCSGAKNLMVTGSIPTGDICCTMASESTQPLT